MIKKMKRLFVYLFILVLFVSCNNSTNVTFEKQKPTNSIEVRINQMKKEGLFDSILYSTSRVIYNMSEDELKEIKDFINNPSELLNEVMILDDGYEQLRIIEALFCGETVNEFADALSYYDEDKSKEYLSQISFINDSFEQGQRNANTQNTLIQYAMNKNIRAAYASDLEWSTIGWYTGFCAATVAGIYAFSYGGLFAKIAGGAAAVAGAASMGYQLALWATCSNLINFTKALAGKNSYASTYYANSSEGPKLMTIISETTVTIIACAISPVGKTIIPPIVEKINYIITSILDVLPKGVNYTFNGISLAVITIPF